MSLEGTTKLDQKGCYTIHVIASSGRKGYLVTSNSGTYLKMDGSNYWDVWDGYLHIDEAKMDAREYGPEWHEPTKAQYIEVINLINKIFFAGKLIVDTDLFTHEYRSYTVGINPIKKILKSMIYNKCGLFDIFENETPKKWYAWRLKMPDIFRYEYVEVKVTKFPSLGATWQKYYKDNSWLKEAEEIKGSQIYLA